jgi:hypothetical protein
VKQYSEIGDKLIYDARWITETDVPQHVAIGAQLEHNWSTIATGWLVEEESQRSRSNRTNCIYKDGCLNLELGVSFLPA